MGGCASRPKESDILEETPVQDNNGGESQIEKPSVDVSEPEKEGQGSSSEPEAAVVEPVSSETVAKTAKPTEDDVKAAAAENSEDKTTVPRATAVETGKPSDAAASEEEVKKDAPVISS